MAELVAAAQYLRKSTDRRKYSLPFQRAAISSYGIDELFLKMGLSGSLECFLLKHAQAAKFKRVGLEGSTPSCVR